MATKEGNGDASALAAKQQLAESTRPEPQDKHSLVYLTFVLLGIGTLLPWNFFISVSAYWNFKYRTINETFDEFKAVKDEATNETYFPTWNEMQVGWGPKVATASMVPNVTIMLLNAIFGHHFRTQPRLLVSLSLVIVLFIFTSAMCLVESDGWQDTFLYVTVASVVVININAAIFQSGLVGVAGKFPPRYIGGVFSGQAVGGILASVTNVLMLATGAHPATGAFFCFAFAVVFLGFSLGLYLWLTKSEFFQHHNGEAPSGKPEAIEAKEFEKGAVNVDEQEKLMNGGSSSSSSPDGPHPPPVKVTIPVKVNPLSVFGKIFPYAFSVYFVFTVTLACFPATTLMVKSVNAEAYPTWANTYFIPVCCFVLFNVGDYLGRLAAEKIAWPGPGKAGMAITFIASLLRVGFIPLFVFCNADPVNRSLPVLFYSDTAYILFMFLFSFSTGYITNICMGSAPQVVEPELRQTAASLMVALLGLGLASGAILSSVVVKILSIGS